ncbi:hypothetical protein HanXRQr2_Chr07g0304201 [Helianthus annuus]|uniref:Uncharacterized protein n=1 Tax=Helianthus annuus TaxID=4232 RepID=A0A251UCE0_HELAN|nr:hypothetical protein HanXRQr2_Chr07g0304201 [Helianthus annuus]
MQIIISSGLKLRVAISLEASIRRWSQKQICSSFIILICDSRYICDSGDHPRHSSSEILTNLILRSSAARRNPFTDLILFVAVGVIGFGVWISTHHDGCRK